uniref:Amidohydro-rel domain-containing protein n=1 Tax=Panagrellus redivivus TaxID=6233 RepID=A0A7E4VP55_PANRE
MSMMDQQRANLESAIVVGNAVETLSDMNLLRLMNYINSDFIRTFIESQRGLLCHELILFDCLHEAATINTRSEIGDEIVYSLAMQRIDWDTPRAMPNLRRLAIVNRGPFDAYETVQLVNQLGIINRVDELAIAHTFDSMDQLEQIMKRCRPRKFMGGIDIPTGVGIAEVLALFDGLELEDIKCSIQFHTENPYESADNFLNPINAFFQRQPQLNSIWFSFLLIRDGRSFYVIYRTTRETNNPVIEVTGEYTIPLDDIGTWRFATNYHNNQ